MGIDSIELASFNEGREYRPVLCFGIVTGKEGGFSVECQFPFILPILDSFNVSYIGGTLFLAGT